MIAEEELVEEELHRYFRRPKKFPFKSRCMDPKLNDKLQDLRESPDPGRRLRAAVIGHNYPCYTPAQVRAYRLNIVQRNDEQNYKLYREETSEDSNS